MSILLYVVGAITLVIGTLATGYGTTINEFSFGNTLIVAGTTAMVGGLIVVGLGAVVAHLQHLADTVATRAPLRPNRPPETVAAGRASPPPRAAGVAEPGEVPPVESPLPGPVPVAAAADEPLAAAPSLPNPDVPPMAAFPEAPEEASVPPPPLFRAPPPVAEPAEAAPPPPSSGNGAEGGAPAFEPELEAEPEPEPLPAWLSPPRTPEPPQPLEPANFESVWPPVKGRAGDQPMAGDNAPDVLRETPEEPAPAAAEPAAESEPPAERRSVAILKSGVVDGMGYTLYVDGSIEAELPQGTLRFASINDLREHLEKTS